MANKKKSSSKKNINSAINKFSFIKDERFRLVLGVFILSFSIYMLFGLVSYLFTWEVDQSKLDLNFFELFTNSSVVVDNWAGKWGAIVAYILMHNWFGLASFGFIFLLALLGFRLLNFKLLPFRRTLKYSIIIIIWSSVALGYFFHQSNFLPGGAHGYFISEWFNSFIGKVGTLFVLLVSLFGILTYLIYGFITKLKKFFNSLFSSKVVDAEINVEKNTVTEEVLPSEPEKNTITDDGFERVELTKKEVNLGDDNFTFEIKSEEPKLEEPVSNTSDNLAKDESAPYISSSIPNFDNIETIEVKAVDESELPIKNYGNIEEQDDSDLNSREANLELSVEDFTTEEDKPVKKIAEKPVGDYDPTLDLSNYKLPPINMLEEYEIGNVSVSEDELHSNKNRIVETLANYKIQIDKIKAVVGPTITLYEIIPAPGVRISKIKNLEDDIALSLAALGIRIIAPIPGRGTIGIEVPNLKPETVSMRSIISSKKFQESKYELPLALGKTISNETFVVDLAKMPHLLVAGATGQGKSVGLNAILTSLLYKKHPSQLKLVLVDPKKVELNLFQKIEKHFLAMIPDADEAIITDTQKVVTTLNSLCIEMDSRYDLLKAAHTRNIKEYNTKFIKRNLNPEKGHKFLPYIVVVIDEFADLIMTAGKDVELPIARLAQLARAIGIHLIIATQRPTTNIITGLIKANFPARIAFRVTSMMDSRTILDSPGANQLIGRGDMLISQGSDIDRLQCAFVDTPEIERIVEFIGEQQSYPSAFMLPEYVNEDAGESPSVDLTKRDVLFDDAARVLVLNQQGSTSLIQRKFSIGYNRAGRIIDQMEVAGVVGPFEGSKARKVLIPDEYSLEQLLSNL